MTGPAQAIRCWNPAMADHAAVAAGRLPADHASLNYNNVNTFPSKPETGREAANASADYYNISTIYRHTLDLPKLGFASRPL